MINICDLIDEDSFSFVDSILSKNEIIDTMLSKISIDLSLSKDQLENSIRNKDILKSSFINNGVLITDIHNNAIIKPKIFITIAPKGIDFLSSDGVPIDIFGLLLTTSSLNTNNIQLLALVSRLLRNNELTNKLRGCKDAASAFVIISQILSIKAA